MEMKKLRDDLESFAAMQGISGYSPANSAFDAHTGAELKARMEASQTREVQEKAGWKASRDRKVSDEWEFHDFVRNMRTQIKAQFGENSDELAAVGLKKKAEYLYPKRKPMNK
ncbi:MAG: hypothetical protein JSS81_25885 [Acidobacteria bacterium]|nr:hypothetical protein [Acidobacteriota bacterium]